MSSSKVIVAAVQAAPVFLDRDATIDKVRTLTKEAAETGAGLVVFPETFVPAYPHWVWRTTPWTDQAWYDRLYDQSVDVPGPATAALGAAAHDAGVHLVVGVNERAQGTLYNSLLFLGPDGTLLASRRKIMPTGAERLVWGQGDGSGLFVLDTPFGRLGGLICWENYMPLARAALYSQGVEIYVAPTRDNTEMWVPTMRHIAKEGRVYVIGVTSVLRREDIPAALPMGEALYGDSDDWMAQGNSIIVGPEGEVLAGPLTETGSIIYAEVDAARARAARRQFDPVGHYARPDILRLVVDDNPKPPAVFTTAPAGRVRQVSGNSDV